ncbi:unnamed protein product [Sphagnum jensenii]|uniref:Serine hydrolase domain-containing protein n=1 Tax=Sphagnum jensenii TaxID=128206 RepID=A0ABP1BTX1_9BRYO
MSNPKPVSNPKPTPPPPPLPNSKPLPPPQKLRLLCLHGYRTSGAIMKEQLAKAKWNEVIDDIVDLTFMNAWWPATGPSDVKESYNPPYYEWYQANKDFSEVYGLDESMVHLNKTINDNGPFDGLLAFSQGAVLACALIGLQEKGLKFVDAPKFGRIVVVGGATSKAIPLKPAYFDPISCPSLHFIGEQDGTRKKAELLVKKFNGAIVVRHPGGRVVPKLGLLLKHSEIFLQDKCQNQYKSKSKQLCCFMETPFWRLGTT